MAPKAIDLMPNVCTNSKGINTQNKTITIDYLSGVRYLNVYVIKLLPLELMNIEILKMYLSFFESHLNNYKKENKEKNLYLMHHWLEILEEL